MNALLDEQHGAIKAAEEAREQGLIRFIGITGHYTPDVIAAETVSQLEHNVSVAQSFQPLPGEEMAAIEQRTAADWQNFSFFRAWG